MIKTLTKVDSTMIYAAEYDYGKQILEVIFTRGDIWHYEDVPKDVYEELMNSNSIGSFMRNNILDCYDDYQIN